MPIVSCSVCKQEMVIDEPNGVAYVTENDGAIHHDTCVSKPAKSKAKKSAEG